MFQRAAPLYSFSQVVYMKSKGNDYMRMNIILHFTHLVFGSCFQCLCWTFGSAVIITLSLQHLFKPPRFRLSSVHDEEVAHLHFCIHNRL